MNSRKIATVVTSAAVLFTLVGCAAAPAPTANPSESVTAEPSAEPTVPTPTESFTMPADCTGVLPAATVDAFAADDVILLAGPGGKYGNELITDPTPEMEIGGISCYFGVDNEDPNQLAVTVLVSAAPLDATSRATVIADLTGLGLLEATDERGDVTFGILGGSEGQTTANHNVIAVDSWISVISSDGGEKAYLSAVELANDAHAAMYN